MRILGVDGYRGGWVDVPTVDGRFEAACAGPRLAALVEEVRPDVVAVHIPIGLVEVGRWACDRAAKGLLAGRSASVFLVPPRPVVEAPDFDEANRRCRALNGQGLSRQAHALAPKILEVDALVGRIPGLIEVHPEVSFRTLAGEPLPRKKSWAGLWRRIALLERVGLTLPPVAARGGQVSGTAPGGAALGSC